MNNEKEIRNIGKLIILHLFPGVVMGIVYILIIKMGWLINYPKIVVAGLSAGLSIIPIEIGYLLYRAKKENGNFNVFKVLGLKNKIQPLKLIGFTLLLFIITGALMTFFKACF